MRRSPSLQTLSREHHTALVWVQRIIRAGDQAARDELMATLPSAFQREIEPHFRLEEELLLPCLELRGAGATVLRTLAEHGQLRDLVAQVKAGSQASLQVFAQALKAHIRFEERELFSLAETLLPSPLLNQADFFASSQLPAVSLIPVAQSQP